MTAEYVVVGAERPTAPPGPSVRRRRLQLSMVAVIAAAAFLSAAGATASAAPGDHSNDTTTANVAVNNAIILSGLTPSFSLNGAPGATVTGNGAVTMTVTTNNIAGYSVTVQAATATLLPTAVGNTDSIPIGNLGVRASALVGPPVIAAGAFTALSNTSAVTIHTQAGRSALGGDAWSNDYQVLIPFVATDTYSAQLNYIATAL